MLIYSAIFHSFLNIAHHIIFHVINFFLVSAICKKVPNVLISQIAFLTNFLSDPTISLISRQLIMPFFTDPGKEFYCMALQGRGKHYWRKLLHQNAIQLFLIFLPRHLLVNGAAILKSLLGCCLRSVISSSFITLPNDVSLRCKISPRLNKNCFFLYLYLFGRISNCFRS